MGKTVRLIPMFRCKGCGMLYHTYQFGILAVNDEKLTEQDAVQKIMKVSEIHECDIDRVGIAVCVGFNKEEKLEEDK